MKFTVEDIVRAIEDHDRQAREARRIEAQRQGHIWDWIDAHGVKVDRLPSRAAMLLGMLGPMHPKDAEYLNTELLKAATR